MTPASDHIVQFELRLPTGQLALEGGFGDLPITQNLELGIYRARMS